MIITFIKHLFVSVTDRGLTGFSDTRTETSDVLLRTTMTKTMQLGTATPHNRCEPSFRGRQKMSNIGAEALIVVKIGGPADRGVATILFWGYTFHHSVQFIIGLHVYL